MGGCLAGGSEVIIVGAMQEASLQRAHFCSLADQRLKGTHYLTIQQPLEDNRFPSVLLFFSKGAK